jgi:hypothetical protein
MKIQTRWIILGIALVLIGIFMMGFSCGYKTKKCPEIKTGIDTVSVQVITHDTIVVEKTRDRIVVRNVPVTQYIRSYDTIAAIADTEQCYGMDQTMPDGAQVYAELCSRSFKSEAPLDLSGSIKYLAPPDTQRTIHMVDTVIVKKPHLWRDIKIGCITFGIGAAVGAGTLLFLGR